MTKHGGEHERSPATAVVSVDFGPGLQKERDQSHVALEGNAPERGLAVIVAAVDLCPVPEEHGGGCLLTIIGGKHEKGVAFTVAEIERQAGKDHLLQFKGLALSGHIQGYELKFSISFFFCLAEGLRIHGFALQEKGLLLSY
mgnify:CR=1 FL=1